MEFSEFLSDPAVIWFLIGLVLLLLEFAIPGLVVMFFGIGAWIVSISCMVFDPGINMQLSIFIVTSLLSLLFLRKYFKKIFYGKEEDTAEDAAEELLGKIVSVEKTIAKGKPGKVIFKGASWKAESEFTIAEGDSAKIIGKESIVLKVEPIN